MRLTDESKVADLLVPASSGVVASELVTMVAQSGALLDSHFRLQSGLHSRYFLRFGQLALDRSNAQRIAQLFLELVGPLEEGTVVLAAETAPRFLAEAIGAEAGLETRLAAVGEMRKPEKRLVSDALLGRPRSVVVVADVLNTGGSALPLVELAREAGVSRPRLFAFATLRAEGADAVFTQLGVEGVCLLQGQWQVHRPEECDLCRKGSELLPGYEFI